MTPSPPPPPPSAINRVIRAALHQRFLIFLLTLVVAAFGAWSYSRLPIDAYPDLSPPRVEVVTQWPGHAAEEVERLISIPIESELNGIPNTKVMRSVSLYGVSVIVMTFQDGTDDYFARQRVLEHFQDLELPPGVTPSMGSLSSPSGLIYRYVLESPDRTPTELKTFEDWVVSRRYKAVAGVADVSDLGGPTFQYQVLIDPTRLAGAGLSPADLVNALANNNANAGGGFYSQGGQSYYIRGLGRLKTLDDIGNVVVTARDGTPLLVKNVAEVTTGNAPRLGQFGYMEHDDAVEGVIRLRKGEQAQVVLARIEKETENLNANILPHDVKVRAFYDRSDLIAVTTRTVRDNLLYGMALVVVVLIFFLYNLRMGLIVAAMIPLSLLVAFIGLDRKGVAANLLSIGAIDFGILVDGAVVMAENIFRHATEARSEAAEGGGPRGIVEIVARAASEVDRPILYAMAIIVAAFLPIYALSGPSGTLFHPMADTMIFALLGSLLFTIVLLPVICALVLRQGTRARRNPAFEWLRRVYARGLDWALRRPWTTTWVSVALLLGSLLLVPSIGAEFMPKLDEGALWIRASSPYSIDFDEAAKLSPQIRAVLRSFPQVTTVTNELGRPDDGTDATGFFNNEFYVGLKPYETWTGDIKTKAQLIEAIDEKLKVYPGVVFNYTQPAEDAVDEALTGLKSSLAVKIYGEDLQVLEAKGLEIKHVLEKVPGITNVTLVRELGQPSLTITPRVDACARYGVNTGDLDALIETAIGGAAATQVVQGEKLFDLVVRLAPEFRSNPDQIGDLLVATPAGAQVPLKELADLRVVNGASFIYREDNSRYIGIQYSVAGRDLASAVQDAQAQVEQQVPLPAGYHDAWGGEFSEYTASRSQLRLVLPLTLFAIFMILFALYGNFKFPLITVVAVLVSAPIGGLLALKLSGTPFSVSSGIGFLALFGVSVQTAVIYISCVNELRREGQSDILRASRDAALLRLRPIMMTAIVAAIGLLPAALSTGIGSDSQRPFAFVIVGGLVSRLLVSVFLMPALYRIVARDGDRLQV
jgi:heavy metal efflux system protein